MRFVRVLWNTLYTYTCNARRFLSKGGQLLERVKCMYICMYMCLDIYVNVGWYATSVSQAYKPYTWTCFERVGGRKDDSIDTIVTNVVLRRIESTFYILLVLSITIYISRILVPFSFSWYSSYSYRIVLYRVVSCH